MVLRKPLIKRVWDKVENRYVWGVFPVKWPYFNRQELPRNLAALKWCMVKNGWDD